MKSHFKIVIIYILLCFNINNDGIEKKKYNLINGNMILKNK